MIEFQEVIEFIDGIGKIRPMDGELRQPRCEWENCNERATDVGWIGDHRAHLCLSHYTNSQFDGHRQSRQEEKRS
jgi:hypothetical protein